MKILDKIKSITWEDVWDKSMDVLTWFIEQVMITCKDIKSAHMVYPRVIYTALVLILIALFV
tara:strand:- start:26 stop:211 length:186 start_codon:yes stop_codon:yes gene_type:complete